MVRSKKAVFWVLGGLLLLVFLMIGFLPSSNQGGKLAPDFTLKTLDGSTFTLSEHRGQKILLIFWATTCPSCRRELTHLQSHFQELPSDVLVVAVSPEPKQNVVAALNYLFNGEKPKFTVLVNGSEVFYQYKVMYTPTNVLVKPDGTIYKRFVGMRPIDFLRTQLQHM